MSLIQRNTKGLGLELLQHFPAVVIQGARQVGKSTLASMITEDIEHLSVTLDDAQHLAAARQDPRAFLEQAEDRLMVIDEIQLEPSLLRAVKASIDQDRRPGRFLLTGSANILRLTGDTDSLAGRAVTLLLRGLTEGERAGVRDDFVDALVNHLNEHKSQPIFSTKISRDDYIGILEKGSFPTVDKMPPKIRRTWIDSYLERVLERDFHVLPGATSPERLRSVANLLAANQSGELVKSRIAENSGIPASTITTYLDALNALYLTSSLNPWTPNLTARETGRKKISVIDSALALRLARITATQLRPLANPLIGGFIESFVVGQLQAQQVWSRQDYQLFHYRRGGGTEIDVIIELDDGRIIALEVKSSSTYKPEHFRGLRFLQENLGERFLCGIVLGMSDSSYQFGKGLWGLPISSLWEL